MDSEELGVRKAVVYLRREAAALTRDSGGEDFANTRNSLEWVADMLEGEIVDVLRTPAESSSS